MKNVTIKPVSAPSSLLGTLLAPASKSQTLRAIIFAMLAKGKSVIHNYLSSDDTIAMLNAIKAYGVNTKISKNKLEITGLGGKLNPPNDIIDAQNSGIILRFIGAIAALNNTFSIITGDQSIKKNRVIFPLIYGLRQLNVYAESLNQDGRPPIIVKGPIQTNKIKITGEDSQPVSALLIASAFSEGQTEIFVENPGEKPWVDVTLNWFNFFKIKYENHNYEHYKIFGYTKIKGFEKVIPADFSSISFPIVAALITNSEITIKNISFEDSGGDKKFIDILKKMGANIETDSLEKTIKVNQGAKKLKGLKIDVNDCIDALPILSVLACFAKGKTTLYNGKIARNKESNRIKAISLELTKMGAQIEEKEDGLIITPSSLKGALVDSHYDHRIAMSLCVAALKAQGPTTVSNVSCVKKSYPTFFDDLKKIKVNFVASP